MDPHRLVEINESQQRRNASLAYLVANEAASAHKDARAQRMMAHVAQLQLGDASTPHLLLTAAGLSVGHDDDDDDASNTVSNAELIVRRQAAALASAASKGPQGTRELSPLAANGIVAAMPRNVAQRLREEGNALYASGNHQGATEKYTEALSHVRNDAGVLLNRATAHAAAGQHELALEDALEAIRMHERRARRTLEATPTDEDVMATASLTDEERVHEQAAIPPTPAQVCKLRYRAGSSLLALAGDTSDREHRQDRLRRAIDFLEGALRTQPAPKQAAQIQAALNVARSSAQ